MINTIKTLHEFSANTLYNVWSVDLPKLKDLIGNIITEGQVHMVYGQSGHLKSTLMLYLAICIASGTNSIFGNTIKSPVLWIDEEMGLIGLTNKIKSLCKGLNLQCNEWMKDFYYITMKDFIVDSKEGRSTLQSYVMKGVKVVFIDSVSATMSGDLKNDSDVKKLRECNKLAYRDNISIVYLAHIPKSACKEDLTLEQIFGSVQFGAMVDCAYQLRKYSDTYRIKQTKGRFKDKEQYVDYNFNVCSVNNGICISNLLKTTDIKNKYIQDIINFSVKSKKHAWLFSELKKGLVDTNKMSEPTMIKYLDRVMLKSGDKYALK